MKKYQQYEMQFLSVKDITTDIESNFIAEHCMELRKLGVQKYYIAHESNIKIGLESSSWLLETIARVEEDLYPNSVKDGAVSIPIQSLIMFDFKKHHLMDELAKQNPNGEKPKIDNDELNEKILDTLKFGIIVIKADGSFDVYERFMRSSSNLRAGGALMIKVGLASQFRNLFSLGVIDKQLKLSSQQMSDTSVEEVKNNQIKVVTSKWEAHMTLSTTNSHAIPVSKMPVIRIVPDMKRIVSMNVKGLKKCDKKDNESYVGLEETYYKTLSEEENDILFEIEEKIDNRMIETVDGCGVASFRFFKIICDVLKLTEEERLHLVLAQIRAPFIKGTISQFDIKGYCDEFNIKTLVDIYGNEFDPRECDLILPESMFKGSAYFSTWEEYLESLQAKYTVNGKTYELFPNNEIIRVANANKAKNPYREMTYQYLQSTIGLDRNALCVLADRLIDDLVAGVTTNVGLAKKFLGLISKTSYENSMVSKAQGLIELNPLMFNSSLVQKVIKETIETSFWNMRTGRIPLRGSYHFIVGDLSILFLNTPEFVRKNKKNILDDSDFCILGNKENYLVGHEGTTNILHRSPQIHPSETRKVSFLAKGVNPTADKYYGHLDGVIIFNSFEPTALCMGGADYDGDKVYRTDEQMLIDAYQEDLPIIISPLEDYKQPASSKLTIAQAELYGLTELDERTLDNLTGIYTNMGSYYINKYYTVIHDYKEKVQLITNLARKNDQQSKYQLEEIRRSYCYSKGIDINTVTSLKQLLSLLQQDYIRLEKLYDYKITIIRIAQAGEIDFPKHGVRFPLPKNVETFAKLHWLDPAGFNEANEKARQSNGMISTPLDTPFERLYAHLNKRSVEIQGANKINTMDLNKYFLNFDNIDRVEFTRILPQVRELRQMYLNGIKGLRPTSSKKKTNDAYAQFRASKHDSENVNANELNTLFLLIKEKASQITEDFKTFASACYFVSFYENETGHGDKFPFTVAFEGLLANLADYDFNNIKVMPVEKLDTLGINLQGNVVVKDDIIILSDKNMALPQLQDLNLQNGTYELFNFRGQHYINVPCILTKEEKNEILFHYFNKELVENMHKSKPTATKVRVNKNVETEITIIGFNKLGVTGEEVAQLIQANNRRISFKSVSLKSKTGDKVPYVGISVGNHDLGTIKRFDRYRVMGNDVVILDDFIGHVGEVTNLEAKYDKKHTKIVSLKLRVLIQTTNAQVNQQTFGDVEKLCHLNSWYWNRQKFQLENFGISNSGVEFANTNPTVNQIFARIKFTKGMNNFYAYVKNGVNDLEFAYIECIENKSIVNVDGVNVDLQATFLRMTDYNLNYYKLDELKSKEMEIEMLKALDVKLLANKIKSEQTNNSNELEELRKDTLKAQLETYKQLNNEKSNKKVFTKAIEQLEKVLEGLE